MKFSAQISQAIDRCLTDEIPFVAFAMPGEAEVCFRASLCLTVSSARRLPRQGERQLLYKFL